MNHTRRRVQGPTREPLEGTSRSGRRLDSNLTASRQWERLPASREEPVVFAGSR